MPLPPLYSKPRKYKLPFLKRLKVFLGDSENELSSWAKTGVVSNKNVIKKECISYISAFERILFIVLRL